MCSGKRLETGATGSIAKGGACGNKEVVIMMNAFAGMMFRLYLSWQCAAVTSFVHQINLVIQEADVNVEDTCEVVLPGLAKDTL